MSSRLDSVKRAARAKTRADARYREAIQQALEAGSTYAEVARALGLSRQAIRQAARRL